MGSSGNERAEREGRKGRRLAGRGEDASRYGEGRHEPLSRFEEEKATAVGQLRE